MQSFLLIAAPSLACYWQFDIASDDESIWILVFFARLVKIGWLKEVRLSMMMVGHPHEDIDVPFRRIVEYWARRGRVSTPSAFISCEPESSDSWQHGAATH
eukprot:1781104-Pleurochrysis_carterae.AAC.1